MRHVRSRRPSRPQTFSTREESAARIERARATGQSQAGLAAHQRRRRQTCCRPAPQRASQEKRERAARKPKKRTRPRTNRGVRGTPTGATTATPATGTRGLCVGFLLCHSSSTREYRYAVRYRVLEERRCRTHKHQTLLFEPVKSVPHTLKSIEVYWLLLRLAQWSTG
jgi:hypothetical protein